MSILYELSWLWENHHFGTGSGCGKRWVLRLYLRLSAWPAPR